MNEICDIRPKKVLLVEPDFPLRSKSRNHHRPLPIGLLKLASYHRQQGDAVSLLRGCQPINGDSPDVVLITSLFTYWSECVWETVRHYKRVAPTAKVVVGGIYASLMPEHCAQSGCDQVFVGLHQEAECCPPAYDLVGSNFQIVHASRGCPRQCSFCAAWRIEPQFTYKRSISQEIHKNRVLFYDNNLLANPFIKDILRELGTLKINGRKVVCETQCGIDGRMLTDETALLLRKAHFSYPRIAWDHGYGEDREILDQIDILRRVGYGTRDIYVFMLYNHALEYEELERKRLKCREWGVQIADCRFRPLDQTFDNYDPHAWRKGQTGEDYYIHPNWTDVQIRAFRKSVREQNIVVRHGFSEYSRAKELSGRKK